MLKVLRNTLFVALAALAPLLVACGEDGLAQGTDAVDLSAHADHADHADHAVHAPAMPAGELPGTSLFHLSSAWTNEEGEPLTLTDLRGKPAVVVMFYGDCTTACPLLVKSAEDIEAALPADLRDDVSFVMVTFATGADTPAKLKNYAAGKGLDRDDWHWLVGSPLQTRQLATLLGVQYRDVGNGMFAHSNVVTVLDRDGVPVVRLEGLGVDPAPAVNALLDTAR